MKSQQAKKLETDNDFIPCSARVKFTLTTSKLAESNVEFLRLKEDAQVLVNNLQKELKHKIISASTLEARLTLEKLHANSATSIAVATQAFIIVEPALDVVNLHKIVHSILV